IDLFQMSFMGTPYWDTSFGELFRVAFDELGPMLSSIADHGTPCVGYPKGGLIKYTSMMCQGISNHDGEIRTNVEIENIILDKGKAVGVRTRDGEEIRAKAIISNAGIKETVLDLVGKEHFEKEYVEYIESLVPGTTGMVVRLALDEPVSDLHAIISFPNKDIQTYFRKVYEEHELPDEIPPHLVTFPSNLDETLVPEGRQNALIILLLGQDTEVDEHKMHDLGLASMEEVIPGISKHIMWSDYLGPKFWRSMGEEGAGIGLAQSIGQVGEKRPSILSPIEDLYYVGMETGKGMSGICGEFAVDSGLACADYIVKNAPVTI
ncbi:MAG: NAD(P)/FAD-dependent oxidoreductase, partial [Actinobacteria bacterium]|nr:NAD(P)/FAD-dependent oxidoreductase [Actinomycetota bacterium]